MKNRYLIPSIAVDLQRKMVWMGGPRQVGKSTLASLCAKSYQHPVYMNWDNRNDRKRIRDGQWPPDSDLLVFDEIHKYTQWKNLIKGFWDCRLHGEHILVTGSSKLDVFRRGGDSLLGRYHYYRLHPFSLLELEKNAKPVDHFTNHPPLLSFDQRGGHLKDLMQLGGFPEPLFSGSEKTLRRWQKERFERIFREDIRDTENIKSLSQVELLGDLLPERVASPLSFQSLSEDIEASPKTVKNWIDLLCRNYFAFRVPPYHKRLARALKKESKYYLWDWSEIPDEGARFENLIASHLLKFCHYVEDTHGISVELHYLRDLEKREVDFLVTWAGKPWMAVEAKLKAEHRNTPLIYFGKALGVSHLFQVNLHSTDDYVDRSSGVRVIPAARFLMALV